MKSAAVRWGALGARPQQDGRGVSHRLVAGPGVPRIIRPLQKQFRMNHEPWKDTTMNTLALDTFRNQPHYALSSVGALMDPAFLRGAVLDASGDRRDASTSSATLRLRWRAAIRAVAAVFR